MFNMFIFFTYICSALCLLWYHITPNCAMPGFTYVYFSLYVYSFCILFLIILFVSLPTITNWTWTAEQQKYVYRFIVNHPVQICVNTINMQNNLLMILSAHYQPAISQLFIRLFRNMYVFCSSCHRQNAPVSLDVNLKEHKLQYIKSNSTCDSGLLMWQCYFF